MIVLTAEKMKIQELIKKKIECPQNHNYKHSQFLILKKFWAKNSGDIRETARKVRANSERIKLVEANYKNKTISHYLQNASTFHLVVDGKPKPITELSIGDIVLTHVRELEDRHYGMKIQEEVIEK